MTDSKLTHSHSRFAVVALAAFFICATSAFAASSKILYTFPGPPDGFTPTASLIPDAAGNLYGVTYVGGDGPCSFVGDVMTGCGSVFELSPNGSGGWTETILYNFQAQSDGAMPMGGLVMDAAGNLYGTTTDDNFEGNAAGTVFELSPPSGGGSWTLTTLHAFQSTSSTDGAHPRGTLIFDQAGNLYGTTTVGGSTGYPSGWGTVFELSPPSGGGAWTETILHNFGTTRNDGVGPWGGVILDAGGNLYGTTTGGGTSNACGSGCGVIYKLSPGSGGSWTESILHDFALTDGSDPFSALTFYHGSFYGTTNNSSTGVGTVFQLTPGHGAPWMLTTIDAFSQPNDAKNPYDGVVFDTKGNLYGTTYYGGTATKPGGAVFKLSPGSGGTWTETLLLNFGEGGAAFAPFGGLLFQPAEHRLIGTTTNCKNSFNAGCVGYGTVFQVTNF